jgi:hypothetical protein
MKVIEAPNPFQEVSGPSIFLAGSIEMGKAEEWQQVVIRSMSDLDCTIYNPRRKDWDSTWEQSIDNEQFRTQVGWELNRLDNSAIAIFYFDPNTQSPVTLVEFGFAAGAKMPKTIAVCCPQGFWRKGNVDIICKRELITQCDSLESLIQWLRNEVQTRR